jgi:SRP54-type protein, GTPase domain
MQDNEPLMRSLAKLVAVNNPDKIIFVGEALVGNEAVDQLTKFNQALKDFSGLQNPRHIDGMILTKFDTIDDKVSQDSIAAMTRRSKSKLVVHRQIGWCRVVYDIHYRTAYLFCGHGSDVHRFEKSQSEPCRSKFAKELRYQQFIPI